MSELAMKLLVSYNVLLTVYTTTDDKHYLTNIISITADFVITQRDFPTYNNLELLY